MGIAVSAYSLFRDTASRRARLGDPEVPGLPNLGAARTITVRALGLRLVEIGGDTVLRRVWWLLPEETPTAGDTLDGYPVAEVAEVKDGAGSRLWWVCYAAG